MSKKPLYTIGHGSRTKEDLLNLLKAFEVKYLIDVRSQPYSKFNPHFNQNEIKFFLEVNKIRYVFMGDSIGGRPNDKSCYDDAGKVDYEALKTKDFFKRGIDRLKVAYNKNVNVALMCSESKPWECHRSKLIGKVLSIDNIPMQHIDEKGVLKDQTTVMNEANEGLPDVDLFGNPTNSTSRNTYI
jgi:uncharacterized protein (DUF488 family)